MELWWVNPCCIVVEQQLKAEVWYGHRPDFRHFKEILNGRTAVDVHGSRICPSLQQHLYQDVIAVPGSFVKSCFVVCLLNVGICNRNQICNIAVEVKGGGGVKVKVKETYLERLTSLIVQQEATD